MALDDRKITDIFHIWLLWLICLELVTDGCVEWLMVDETVVGWVVVGGGIVYIGG